MADVMIAGEWVAATSVAPVIAPWDGETVGEVGLADDAQIERAMEIAHRAAPALAQEPSHRRRDALRRVSARLTTDREPLAVLLAREAGKPIALARGEVDRAATTFGLAAEEATRLGGDVMPLDLAAGTEGVIGAWTRVPAGPVLAITPFNFPLNLVAHKLAPALALGAPVVLKPAPQTPLTALALGRILLESGISPTALSVVPTTNELAQRMTVDERFAVLSFTGSAAVGWTLKSLAGKKRTLLELGGNASAIVAPDADVDAAVARIVSAAFGYAGQVCIKTQRAFVHESIFPTVVEAINVLAKALTVSDPLDEAAVCGPLIDVRSATRVRAWLDEAVEGGARLLVGGHTEANRMAPAVVLGASEGMRLVDQEVFGPVLTVQPYTQLDEVVRSIERGRYGLQAAVFTHDVRIITTLFRALHVGALIVNDATALRVDSMPYGGVKDSGLGREGVRFAIDEMSDKRLLVLRT